MIRGCIDFVYISLAPVHHWYQKNQCLNKLTTEKDLTLFSYALKRGGKGEVQTTLTSVDCFRDHLFSTYAKLSKK